jgi:DNA invertase Pin-like site-specific DNA recombinase
MRIGYARVSSSGQSLDVQLEALERAGCKKIYSEKESASSRQKRIELERAIGDLREGDELLVTRLDRLARSVPDLYGILQQIDDAGAGFHCLQQSGIETGTATGKLMLGVLGAVAQFERDLLLERQREGIAKAKARGVYSGGKRKIEASAVREALAANQGSATLAARALGISRASVYRVLEEAGAGEPSSGSV